MDDFRFGFRAGDLAVIIQTLSLFAEIDKAVIFGSRANGNFNVGSDTDIAVWITGNDIVAQLAGILNEETPLPYKFDVLNYDKVNHAELKQQIDLHGIEIYLKK